MRSSHVSVSGGAEGAPVLVVPRQDLIQLDRHFMGIITTIIRVKPCSGAVLRCGLQGRRCSPRECSESRAELGQPHEIPALGAAQGVPIQGCNAVMCLLGAQSDTAYICTACDTICSELFCILY